MKTVMNIGTSLVKLYGWKVRRFDIQRCADKHITNEWYVGYLDITTHDGQEETIIIHDNGEFEIREQPKRPPAGVGI